ncbi:putative protein N(5)-glutamine methyltransferase [Streptomyces sp. NPDC060194]|uniref:putative protein N(5)-glutamine methyltransferase n=1 Tax=Streptomyces sp. NPDC060194 TaxID=3347069 RepID=UPI00364EA088
MPVPQPSSSPVREDTHASVTAQLRAAGCVFAEDEARLMLSDRPSAAELDARIARRAAGYPLEHVLGWAEFLDLRITVADGVFVPRRRSEFLARLAIGLVPRPGAVAVDLCCGSGAVGAALLIADDRVEVHAADIDPAAVDCARRNVTAPRGHVHAGDLYAALPATLRGRVDVLVANAPYVPTGDIGLLPPEAREHEPRVALDGGADGLDVQRRVVEGAAGWLAPGGSLLIETSERQAPATAAAFAAHGLAPRAVECDELYATVVIGTRPPGRTAG